MKLLFRFLFYIFLGATLHISATDTDNIIGLDSYEKSIKKEEKKLKAIKGAKGKEKRIKALAENKNIALPVYIKYKLGIEQNDLEEKIGKIIQEKRGKKEENKTINNEIDKIKPYLTWEEKVPGRFYGEKITTKNITEYIKDKSDKNTYATVLINSALTNNIPNNTIDSILKKIKKRDQNLKTLYLEIIKNELTNIKDNDKNKRKKADKILEKLYLIKDLITQKDKVKQFEALTEIYKKLYTIYKKYYYTKSNTRQGYYQNKFEKFITMYILNNFSCEEKNELILEICKNIIDEYYIISSLNKEEITESKDTQYLKETFETLLKNLQDEKYKNSLINELKKTKNEIKKLSKISDLIKTNNITQLSNLIKDTELKSALEDKEDETKEDEKKEETLTKQVENFKYYFNKIKEIKKADANFLLKILAQWTDEQVEKYEEDYLKNFYEKIKKHKYDYNQLKNDYKELPNKIKNKLNFNMTAEQKEEEKKEQKKQEELNKLKEKLQHLEQDLGALQAKL